MPTVVFADNDLVKFFNTIHMPSWYVEEEPLEVSVQHNAACVAELPVALGMQPGTGRRVNMSSPALLERIILDETLSAKIGPNTLHTFEQMVGGAQHTKFVGQDMVAKLTGINPCTANHKIKTCVAKHRARVGVAALPSYATIPGINEHKPGEIVVLDLEDMLTVLSMLNTPGLMIIPKSYAVAIAPAAFAPAPVPSQRVKMSALPMLKCMNFDEALNAHFGTGFMDDLEIEQMQGGEDHGWIVSHDALSKITGMQPCHAARKIKNMCKKHESLFPSCRLLQAGQGAVILVIILCNTNLYHDPRVDRGTNISQFCTVNTK